MDFLSIIPGVDWPALPNARGCQLLALQFQLDRSQWLPAVEIERQQARLAERLYRHAILHVPYYRATYAAAGFRPGSIRSIDDWLRLPILRRGDLQARFEDLQCRVKEHGEVSLSMTTGSSGMPTRTVGTAVTRILWHALTLRHHLWNNRDFSGKLATIRALRERDKTGRIEEREPSWGSATADILRTGPLVALDIHTSVDEQAAWLVREDPDYLLTYPSIAVELIQYMDRNGLRLPRLRELRTFGELLDPRLRELCQRNWGVPVVDGYSSQEVGYIAQQCPETEQYHVQAESVLVEVLDDEGRPCQPGATGRVVVTTLHNFAMPLIRYEIGDYAEVGDKCPCGRGLPVLRRIVGRQRNLAVLPDGRTVWPCLSDRLTSGASLSGLPPIRQYQVTQIEPDAVEVKAVAARPLTEVEEDGVRALVADAFGWPMRVELKYVERIERGPGGKFEEYRCHLAPDVVDRLQRLRKSNHERTAVLSGASQAAG
ncbi:MAG: phenylacetate--CoA ligase family protein [Planctomycetaceae bacterium]|nr:phenylacetate--CoA ligase family protein [Planctomycetaceae bacterium]